jgi:hypothetical protein
MRDDCIVRFVDIGEIVDRHRLNFLFIICVIKFISEVLTVGGFSFEIKMKCELNETGLYNGRG